MRSVQHVNYMESPTSKLARVLSGFILSLVIVVSVSIQEVGFPSNSDYRTVVPALFSIIAGVVLVSIIIGGRRPHGEWFTDSWISREPEDEMRSRLEIERDEANIQDLGSRWARMEMEHLEEKHGEE